MIKALFSLALGLSCPFVISIQRLPKKIFVEVYEICKIIIKLHADACLSHILALPCRNTLAQS